jgi:hypothetical protein
LLQVPGLQGTAAWAHAEKVIREQQDAENHQTHLNGGSGITFNEVVVWVEVEAVCELKGAATSAAYLSRMLIHLRKCVLSFAWGISPFHQSSSQKNRLSY